MALYKALSGETVFDVAVKLYKDTPLGVSDLLALNDIDLDSDLVGLELTYTEGLKREKPVFVIETNRPLVTLYVSREKQSIYDLAVQLYGDVSKIGNLLELFPNLDSLLTLNTTISVPEQVDPIAVQFLDRRLIVATDLIGFDENGVTADNTIITADSTLITADQTIY